MRVSSAVIVASEPAFTAFMVSSKMLTAAPKQPSVTDLDARCSSTCQIHQGMWRQVDERDPLSPTNPLEQRFQMFQPRLTPIKPRPKASRIVHDFEQQVVHLRIERLGRPCDGARLVLGDSYNE
jgi:hypothetical protein